MTIYPARSLLLEYERRYDEYLHALEGQKLNGAVDSDLLRALEKEYLRCLRVLAAIEGIGGSEQYLEWIKWLNAEDDFLLTIFRPNADDLYRQTWPRLKLRLVQIRGELMTVGETFLAGYQQELNREAEIEKTRRTYTAVRNSMFEEQTRRTDATRASMNEESAAMLRNECPLCHHSFGLHSLCRCNQCHPYWG
jgi:hypothetical protein